MNEMLKRTELLIGAEGIEKLKNSHVAIAGIGGVGSYAAEAMVRTGVGTVTIVDFDTVDVTNINRQIHALYSTVGKRKVKVMAERMADINPDAVIIAKDSFTRQIMWRSYFAINTTILLMRWIMSRRKSRWRCIAEKMRFLLSAVWARLISSIIRNFAFAI